MSKYIIAITVLFSAVVGLAKDEPPGVITEFCAKHLHGDIAAVLSI